MCLGHITIILDQLSQISPDLCATTDSDTLHMDRKGSYYSYRGLSARAWQSAATVPIVCAPVERKHERQEQLFKSVFKSSFGASESETLTTRTLSNTVKHTTRDSVMVQHMSLTRSKTHAHMLRTAIGAVHSSFTSSLKHRQCSLACSSSIRCWRLHRSRMLPCGAVST